MKTARFLLAKGFTLVELLIVIALIGVLAVAVLAAINPLEQLNRARDTGMESDASQLLAAIDRYYASHEEFPWVTVDREAGGNTIINDSAIGFINAQVESIGICGADCADNDGVLLTNLELKSEFRNRKFVTTIAETEMLYIGKEDGASSSVYACWIPTSMAKRDKATKTLAITDDIADPADFDDTVCDPKADDITWLTTDASCFYCIPQ
jgi:prepilin-type N-terminal cleavage/methylation domain-containing protein